MTKIVTYVEIDVPSWTPTSPETDQTFRFAIPTDYLRNDIDCIPSIDSVSFTPQRISLGENLGQRATLRVTLRDHKHVFADEPYDSGTFFGKWRARYGNKLRGRALRIYRGTSDQDLADMEIRYYVIDFVNGPLADASYAIEAKDPLKWADEDRAQAPVISDGVLAGSLNTTVTSLTLSPTGVGSAEYPASGYVSIGGKEACSFTRVGDTLTIVRARLNTTAVAHDAGERVQLVLTYDGDDVADIVYDLLVNYAGVPASYIDLAVWQAETASYMGGILYAANITEPTSVRKLINELIQQSVICLYWDDRYAQIRLKVIREISTTTSTFTDDDFIQGSFRVSEQPDKRLSQVWCFYTQRDPTDTGGNEENFKNILADVDLDREYEYGGSMIRKTMCRWIQTSSAAERYTSLQLSHYRDPPRAYSFDLTRGTAVSPALGYTVQWWGEQNTDGSAASVPVQVTQVTIFADRVHVECEEMLVSGQVTSRNLVFYYVGSGTVTRPATWNNADNTIHMIGAGSGGSSGQSASYNGGGPGGAGGAYSALNNFSMAATEPYTVGAGGAGGNSVDEAGAAGGDTYFSSVTTGLAKGGGAPSGVTGGVGGQASAGYGDVKYSGGNGGPVQTGGTSTKGSSGGGAAAGPHGNGGGGGGRASTVAGESGGGGGGGADGGETVGNLTAIGHSAGSSGGDNRFNFGGGSSATPAGQEGGGGRGCDFSGSSTGGVGGDGEQIWTQTIAPIISVGPGGGGGGGSSSSSTHGFNGGSYGGGGGGGHRNSYAGNGADGILILEWVTA